MKILILTQPLIENYGGILQNYALQTVLKKRGHSVCTLDFEMTLPLLHHVFRIFSVIKQILLRIAGKNHNRTIRQWMTRNEKKICYNKISRFIQTHISRTHRVSHLKGLRKYEDFEAYVVGSDQVWRKSYSPCLPVYFLDFLPENNSAKKISYAASFGSAKLDLAPKEIEKYSRLLQRFDAVSVREPSGKLLCKNKFGVNAEVVPDPTMLLTADDYRKVMGTYKGCAKGKLVTYILDENSSQTTLINKFAAERNLEIIRLRGSYTVNDIKNSVPEKAGIDFWLGALESAEYVITDSFHGTVFSLIFQKEFFVFVNHARGKERFDMLDEKFDIQSRFVDPMAGEIILQSSLNYTDIGKKLEQYRLVGESFLLRAGM
ncbi:MAG: polysaccharide pyruvyl transferase family protein [Lentisphaeria bacterium]|nr:polysaccharide pyruvyl transferase family protein [Lentisphaeria bacterium]